MALDVHIPAESAPENTPEPQTESARRAKRAAEEIMLPRSLMARTGLTIVIPLILVQVISTYIFYDNHMDVMQRRMSANLGQDITSIAASLQTFPSPENRTSIFANAKQALDFDLSLDDGKTLNGPHIIAAESDADDKVEEELWETLRRPFIYDLEAYRTDNKVSISIQLPEGVLHVLTPRARLFSHTTYVFVIWMTGSSILLFGVAMVYLRSQVQTVRRLAQAADAFGKGRDLPDIVPEGAFEVRQVARAFNIMRNRIRRQMVQRTEMLAGVSHDLRTPLTRMKLQLALMPARDDVAALKEDLSEMERMLEAYLAFARGDGAEEARPVELSALLETIVARFRREAGAVDLIAGDLPREMPLKAVAFERCLSNLIANALRYGTSVTVRAGRIDRMIELHVDDDGPGIPPEKREEVFRAFHRLEPSRNPATGGIGLGLTIARDIVRGMGGDIALSDSPRGGLRASLRIPL